MNSQPDPRPIQKVVRPFTYSLDVPGSKSIALRHMAMSALASGPSTLYGIPPCDDIDAMTDVLGSIGVAVFPQNTTYEIEPKGLQMRGASQLNAHMSGVTLRISLAIAALREGESSFDGHQALHARPNAELLNALVDLGCVVRSRDGRLPIQVLGPVTRNQVSLRADISSQYITALLIAAPYMRNGLTIELTGFEVSTSYVDITIDEMARRGVRVSRNGRSLVTPKSEYDAGEFTIESDASAATYHAALATMHESTVEITNIGDATRQGDYAFFELCERMGARVERTATQTKVTGPSRLQGIGRVDMVNCPDAAQTLMAVAPYLPTPTRIEGLATLRVKECDRISCSVRELQRANVQADEGEDFIVIHPSTPTGATFDTYDDHRMAMWLATFASRIGSCAVRDPHCVAKTYSNFWSDFDLIYQ